MADSHSPILKMGKPRLREMSGLLKVTRPRSAEPKSISPKFRTNVPIETVVKNGNIEKVSHDVAGISNCLMPQKTKVRTKECRNPVEELPFETRALVLSHKDSTHTSLRGEKCRNSLAPTWGLSWARLVQVFR